MGKQYFKKRGFKGLASKSKMICIAVFFFVGFVSWFVFRAGADNIFGIIKTIGISLLIAWIVQFFLPRDTYYHTEYFCADCGQYLGLSPGVCDRCGCNRYTTSDSGVGRTVRGR